MFYNNLFQRIILIATVSVLMFASAVFGYEKLSDTRLVIGYMLILIMGGLLWFACSTKKKDGD